MKAVISISSSANERSVWWRSVWFWLVAIGPIAVVFASICTYFIAWKTSDSLVDPNYYQKGLAMKKEPAIELGSQMQPAKLVRNHAATGGAPAKIPK